MLLQAVPAISQNDRLDSLLLGVLGSEKTIKQLFDQPSANSFIYSGISCDNKTFYAGREIGENMFSVNGNIYLFHSKGFFLGTSGSWYSELDPKYSLTSVTAGMRSYLNKKNNLNFRIFYSRYFYNSPDTTIDYSFKNSIGTGLVLRNNWIGGRISLNVLFGKEFGVNLSPCIFSSITLARFGKYGKILLSPEMSLFAGSEIIEDDNGSIISDAVNSYSSTTEKFGLLNTQAFLPLGFYTKKFDFELGCTVNIPMTRDKNISYPVSSFITLSIGYLLPLK